MLTKAEKYSVSTKVRNNSRIVWKNRKDYVPWYSMVETICGKYEFLVWSGKEKG